MLDVLYQVNKVKDVGRMVLLDKLIENTRNTKLIRKYSKKILNGYLLIIRCMNIA